MCANKRKKAQTSKENPENILLQTTPFRKHQDTKNAVSANRTLKESARSGSGFLTKAKRRPAQKASEKGQLPEFVRMNCPVCADELLIFPRQTVGLLRENGETLAGKRFPVPLSLSKTAFSFRIVRERMQKLPSKETASSAQTRQIRSKPKTNAAKRKAFSPVKHKKSNRKVHFLAFFIASPASGRKRRILGEREYQSDKYAEKQRVTAIR